MLIHHCKISSLLASFPVFLCAGIVWRSSQEKRGSLWMQQAIVDQTAITQEMWQITQGMCSESLSFWQGPTLYATAVLPGVWLFSVWSCLWGSHPLLTESEVRWLLTIITLTGGNVDVQQKPPIQVALLKEGISIPCKVIFPYMPKYTKFSIFYYWMNSLDQKTSVYSRLENVPIPSGEENKTAALSYDYKIMPLESTSFTGTYYCEVKWNDIQKMGKGVFILARGKWPTRKEGQEVKNQLDLAVQTWSLLFFFYPNMLWSQVWIMLCAQYSPPLGLNALGTGDLCCCSQCTDGDMKMQ